MKLITRILLCLLLPSLALAQQQVINVGLPNNHAGDELRTWGQKDNANAGQLYGMFGGSSCLHATGTVCVGDLAGVFNVTGILKATPTSVTTATSTDLLGTISLVPAANGGLGTASVTGIPKLNGTSTATAASATDVGTLLNVSGLMKGNGAAAPTAATTANVASVINVTGIPVLSPTTAAAAAASDVATTVGGLLQPQTTAESAASVTPVSLAWPVGHPFRYMTSVQIADVLSGTTPTHDVTAALQATINLAVSATHNANYAVFWPAGHYLISTGLTIPLGFFVDIGGAGRGTVLYAGGSSPVISWADATCCLVTRSHIHDLAIEGSGGGANLMSFTGISNFWVDRVHINDLPAGFDGIFIDGAASTAMHEAHVRDVEVYQNGAVAGNAGIEFGAHAADSEVTKFVTEGDSAILYGIEIDSGASSISVSDSHISGLANNTTLLAGNNTRISFINNFFDTSNSDIVSIGASSSNIRFVGDRFFNIPSTFSGIKIASSTGVTGSNLDFATASGAAAMVTETGSSDSNTFMQVQSSGSFTAPAVFTGLNSALRPLGGSTVISGVAGSLAASTTVFVGNGSSNASQPKVQVPMATAAIVRGVLIEGDAAPGGSATFTATVEDNTTATSCVATITGAAFTAQAGCFVSIPLKDSISVQLVSSAGAVTSNVRASVLVDY